MSVNASSWQGEYWNGDAGKRWALHREQVDRALRPFGMAMVEAARLKPGEAVLDVGCGCGATSLMAAQRVGGGGSVTGVDISAPMIERARTLASDVKGLTFVCADAAACTLGTTFDAMISRYGLMFFEDPLTALGRLRSQLSPMGRTAFVAWRALAENQWLELPLAAVCQALRSPPPRPASGPSPFAFADAQQVCDLLKRAGFADVKFEAVHAPVRMSESGLAEGVRFVELHAGPVGRVLAEADETARARALEALGRALAPYVREQVLELNGSAWLFTASAS